MQIRSLTSFRDPSMDDDREVFYRRISPRPTWWEGDLYVGTAVIHNGRFAHIVGVPPVQVKDGCVPIMYDDESRYFVSVLPAELVLRFPEIPVGNACVQPDTE